MNAHRVQRMACDRDRRTDVVLRNGLDRGAASIGGVGLRRLFGAHAITPRAQPGETHGRRWSATRQPYRSFLVASLVSATAPLAGCRSALSTLDAAGPAADSIETLWWAMLIGAAALFALVIALFWWAYRKPGFAAHSAPRTWLVHAGVVMPSIVLAVLAVSALILGEQLVAKPRADIVRVEAIATRWTWQFRYPEIDEALITSELHIPAGRTVEVRVVSNDVIHSFWVPRLAGKIDAIPGHETRVRLQADRPGRFEGLCAEFCGLGHTDMRFRVVAHEGDDYRRAITEEAR